MGRPRQWTPGVLVALVVVACTAQPQPPDGGRRRGEGRLTPPFTDVSRQAGLPRSATRTWGAAWADIDSDGRPDLFVGRHLRWPWLLRAAADGSFTRVRRAVLRRAPDERTYFDRHSCAWGETGGDRRTDLVCASGAQHGAGRGPNQVLVQAGGGMVERARRLGVADPLGRGRTVNWLDFDHDGDLDLFVGNQVRPGHPNTLYRREGSGFVAVRSAVATELATVASAWADWDRDGFPDLIVLGDGARGSIAYRNVSGSFVGTTLAPLSGRVWQSAAWGDYDGDGYSDLHLVGARRAVVLHNRRGRFTVEHRMRLRHGRASAWLDVDNDSDLDLYVVQGAPPDATGPDRPDLLLVRERGRFVARRVAPGVATGGGDSVAVADFDRDGRTDALVTNGYEHARGPVQLLRNRVAGGRSVAVWLWGPPGNPLGIGARVRALAGGRRLWREVTDGVSGRSQSEVAHLVIGIGGARRARIEVLWPDGRRDCVAVTAGSEAIVRPGSAPCRG